MRLFLLTALTMTAFAGNSLLNRAALAGRLIDPVGFAVIRTVSGAVALAALALLLRRGLPLGSHARLAGAAALATYMLGFSLAYVALDAGAGALILFGGVQVTMLAGAFLLREPVPPRRIAGVALALAGLAFMTLPAMGMVPSPGAAALMALAAAGWGVYGLIGRKAGDPIAATAAHFVLAAPLLCLALPFAGQHLTPAGVALALVSGILTSGLGYALWYAVLPALGASRAAAAQLTVPVIVLAAGAVLLAEPVTLPLALAAAVILAGVALAVLPAPQRRIGSSGS
jgi:drug/metabolite transporter (DMT)-like permease